MIGFGGFRRNRSIRLTEQVSRWQLWDVGRSLIGYVLAVDLIAAGGVAYSFAWTPIDQANWFVFGMLMIGVVLYTEASRPIEREPRVRTSTPHLDANSVWTFAAVLLLHPGLAAIVIVTCYTALWFRVGRRIVYRQVFSVSATVLSGQAAYLFLAEAGHQSFADTTRSPTGFAVVVAAGCLFLLINTVLITTAVLSTMPGARLREALAEPGDYALEAATIGLGVLMAWAVVDWPIAVLLITAITLVLHRSVLIRHLREKARADGKTGLLKADAWAESVTMALTRRSPSAGLLMIDIDHFKRVNDEYGHLVGDEVLRAVAGTLKAEVRASDVVGRYGGDEFVVFLPATTATDAMAIAERIRRRVAENAPRSTMDCSVSIGISARDDGNSTLDDLLHAADLALYEAKDAGRNRSAMSTA
ncbi:diguanylate cyclase (GGDEF)-like protein [Kibdelosporangium banguiense]|uniref:Diguanylate cyclase (GGDEF)-like protein n=1 Tax=Kibdelosporangium banguiense TaxID=1365924 RepID=A0ABS4TAC2_9PSEU|nr:GGDEF domain-containing protein [Kibdelosporangium banguiense]MBP2321374.1 diguanylate cyclase (GGDEF)-like protein [Kibdelosporangium banguiense]